LSPKPDDLGRPIKKRYRLIACEIAYRELCWCVARSPAIIDMGLADELGYEQEARARAQKNGWAFERIEGEWSLLEGLARGEWDQERFLVVRPGHRVEAAGDETIFRAVPGEEGSIDE